MATTNTRYVDPNAPVGGDGTTNSIEVDDPHCAYKSLAIWEAARQADLVTGDIIEKAICSSDDAGSTHLADTTALTIEGWTTDATRYVQIEAASSHGGKWDDTIYSMSFAGKIVDVEESYVNVIGLQIQVPTVSWKVLAYVGASAGVVNFDKCIFRCFNQQLNGDNIGIQVYRYGSGIVVNVTNSLFYDFNYSGVYGVGCRCDYNNQTLNIANCTFHNVCKPILQTAGTCTATNCGFSSAITPISGTVAQTTCSASTPTFVDADSDDFHLASTDTTWKNQGTDLSADFTDDIDGETRSAWDIGCDEYVSGAAAVFYFGDRSGGLQNPFATGFTGGLR